MLLMVGCKLPADGRAHQKRQKELVAKNATHIEMT
jgi:hypothetical protein